MLNLSHTKSWTGKSILLSTTFFFFFQLENKAYVNCHESITDVEAHTAVCNGGGSGHQQLTIPLLFEHADLEQPFDTTQKTYDTLAEMFPNATAKAVSEASSASHTYEEAVIQLSAKSEEKKKFKSSEEVISAYKERNLAKNDSSFYTIEITRDNLWRDAIRFYKVSMANKELLLKRPSIEFKGEDGIDAGALSVEFFSKFLDMAQNQLFEETPGKFLIPKRSGMNLELFKVSGIAVGHIILHGGPPFQSLAHWCFAILSGRCEEEITAIIARESFEKTIPLNAGISKLLSFLKALGKVSSDDEINQLFDESAEGPAYEQVVNSSQWPIDTKYTMSNLEALKSLLVWEELFEKRERQLKAIREGLEFIGLLPFICLYPDLTSAFFIDKEIPLTSEIMNTVINWQRLTTKMNRNTMLNNVSENSWIHAAAVI